MSESIQDIKNRLRENENEIERLKKLFSDSQVSQNHREAFINEKLLRNEKIMKSIDESLSSLKKEIDSLKASIAILEIKSALFEKKLDNLTSVIGELFWYIKLLLFIVVAFWISMMKPAQLFPHR